MSGILENTNKPSVLIIGNDHTDVDTLSRILEEDYTVYATMSGTDGVKLALKHKPSVILFDVNMPKWDGCQAIGGLRSNRVTSHIPIVFISANVFNSELDDTIVKPFVPANVRHYVQKFVAIKKLH